MRTALRWIVVILVTAHGLIHLLGAAKGLGWAQVTALTEPITTAVGVGWLLAGLLAAAAGLLLAVRAQFWWAVMAVAALVSQAVILTAWNDAKVGSVVNLVMIIAAGYGYASQGPPSFQTQYRRRVEAARTGPGPHGVVTEADLLTLPAPVAAYVRRSGAVRQPRIVHFHAIVHGRIRSGRAKPWMTFTGEQFNTVGAHPRRFFLMDATMLGLPVDVLHVFDNGSATMRAKVCSVVPMVNAAGSEMDRGETVTVFNDLCVLAPGALIDAPITWQPVDDHHARGSLTIGAHTVTADLIFNADHDLVDFISDDRLRASLDGRTFTQQRWSTPIAASRAFGPWRVAVTAEAHWHAPQPEGEFAYVEFHIDDVIYNAGSTADSQSAQRSMPERQPATGRPTTRSASATRSTP